MQVLEKADSKKSLGVPELVCNIKSFAQTVENLFTLSFLVSGFWHGAVSGMGWFRACMVLSFRLVSAREVVSCCAVQEKETLAKPTEVKFCLWAECNCA